MIGRKKHNIKQEGYHLSTRYLFRLAVVLATLICLIPLPASIELAYSEASIQNAETGSATTIIRRGSRGMITDAHDVILAKDEPIRNITFYHNASQSSKKDYEAFTRSIRQGIDILELGGNQLSVTFAIQRNPESGVWEFNFGSEGNEAALQTRESEWRSGHDCLASSVPTAADAIEELKERYQIPWDMDEETMLKVMAVYSAMQMNLSQPIVIAKDVSNEIIMEFEKHSSTLPGMEVAVGAKRVYPQGELAAQVIGYTGAIPSTTQWAELQPKGYQYSDTIGIDGIEASMEDYLTQNSDLRPDGNNVKLTLNAGYQQQAERALAANVAYTRASQEKKLLQSAWLEANRVDLENRDFERYPLSLASRGAMMVIDMEGHVLAMANYPTYDLNALAAAGKESESILLDPRNLLMNYNIHARGTPGSVFQMVSGLGAMLEGELYANEIIHDDGYFTLYTSDLSIAPTCWISASQRYKHQCQSIVQGLSNSCNFFFYTLGSRLGETRLYEYASQFGLTRKTGVELPGEQQGIVGSQTSLYDPDKPMDEASQDTAVPIIVFNAIREHLREQGESRNLVYDDERLGRCVKRLMDMAVNTDQTNWVTAMRPILMEELNMTREMVYLQAIIGDTYNYLNDIKWGGSRTIQVSIGQSITTVTPAAVSRYVAALGNGGKVYNLSIVDSITSPEGEIISQREPSLLNSFEGAEEYLPLILEGMKGVVDESGTAAKYFQNWIYRDQVAAMTGTAEVTSIDLENNAWFVMLAPLEKPEIAVVVFIPNGLGGGEASMAARDFVEWYMDQRTLRTDNALVPGGSLLALKP